MSKKNKIAFLGEYYSYHHIAAKTFWGDDTEFIPCASFPDIINRTESAESDYGIIAVENSVAGDVSNNFELISRSGLSICGEIILKIELLLAAMPGSDLSSIKTVYSHLMAIKETSRFFEKYPNIQFVETESTSQAAKIVSESGALENAALAGKTAIQQFGLNILASEIDNDSDNHTRFLMLCRNIDHTQTTNIPLKASLLLQSADEEQLVQLDKYKELINNFILSRSIIGVGKYVEVNIMKISQFDNIGLELTENQVNLRVLGVYERGKVMEGL